MRGLLRRLSALDPGAESAVRIIAFFDALTTNRASFESLARAAASFAEASVGIRDGHGVPVAGSDPRGRPVAPPTHDGVVERGFGRPPRDGTLWLERVHGQEPLDELLLERMAVAAEVIADRRVGLAPSSAEDPALVRALVSSHGRDVERSAAARTMGLGRTVVVVAIELADDDADLLPGTARAMSRAVGVPVRCAVMGEDTGCLVASTGAHEALAQALGTVLVPSVRAGVGDTRDVLSAHLSCRAAMHALAFARADGRRGPVVTAAELGAVAALAAVPRGELGDLADVQAIDELAAGRGGHDILTTLEAVCTLGTNRRAATALHLHHSSVAHRMSRAERVLGFPLDSADHLFRARLALELWQLRGH